MANQATKVRCDDINQDIEATARCLNQMGATITYEKDFFTVNPIQKSQSISINTVELTPGESGSTLRFLLPIVCAMGLNARFVLEGRLSERPLSPLKELLEENGAKIQLEGNCLYVSGQVSAKDFTIPGNVSSQFISGLLFMLSQTGGNITITGKTESQPYIDMTVKALSEFGCIPVKTPCGYTVPKSKPLVSPGETIAKGDWSNAAFFITAGVIGKEKIKITDIDIKSSQGDKAIIEILKSMGARIDVEDTCVIAYPSQLTATKIDATQIPDLVPILSVAAAASRGTTQISGAARLRIKESDRIVSTCNMLQKLGVKYCEMDDGMIIEGSSGMLLPGSGDMQIDSYNDHRIAMSSAIAATICNREVTVCGAQAVSKSYPEFWNDYHKLAEKERI